jgi:hypothetical protein
MDRRTLDLYHSAFNNFVRGLQEFQQAYKKEHSNGWEQVATLAEDGVVGDAFQDVCLSLRVMLGAAPEQLDRSAIDRSILTIAKMAGFDDGLLKPKG